MNTQQVIDAIRDLLGQHEGSELELKRALNEEAHGWSMREQELEDEEDA